MIETVVHLCSPKPGNDPEVGTSMLRSGRVASLTIADADNRVEIRNLTVAHLVRLEQLICETLPEIRKAEIEFSKTAVKTQPPHSK